MSADAAPISAADAALVERYLAHVRVEKRLAERTLALYSLDLEKLAHFASHQALHSIIRRLRYSVYRGTLANLVEALLAICEQCDECSTLLGISKHDQLAGNLRSSKKFHAARSGVLIIGGCGQCCPTNHKADGKRDTKYHPFHSRSDRVSSGVYMFVISLAAPAETATLVTTSTRRPL